jgi:mannose-1-phosphate guanylyltransferase
MVHVMLMAGGKGTRFWPLSRQNQPKQFLSILDDQSLLDTTLQRIEGLYPNQKTWILGSEAHHDVLSNYSDRAELLLEPQGRNTAACITWACLEVLKEDPEAICIVLSADAWVDSVTGFQSTLRKACDLVTHNECVVTIGIPPTRPHTGYGYIGTNTTSESIYNVKTFTEKPDLSQAQAYLDEGNYYWNAGMFVWKADVILNCIKTHLPHHYETLQSFTKKNTKDPQVLAPYYDVLEPISIDYGVLEHISQNMVLVEAEFTWDDIGNWSSLTKYLPNDTSQNASNTSLLMHNSHRNIVFSQQKKKVVLAHMDDIIVVDTPDALLILPKEHDQDIKTLYDSLDPELQ